MATVILVRHGRTTANVAGMLAGRTAGVRLDARGREQAERAGERLAVVPLVGIVSSPLERCRQTARHIFERQGMGDDAGPSGILLDKGITECDYGEWQGRSIKDLAAETLWSVVQSHPSAAVFPGGESMAAMQARSVAAIRRHDAEFETQHGPGAVWVAVSHGDIISICSSASVLARHPFRSCGTGRDALRSSPPTPILVISPGFGQSPPLETHR
jgi:probable phosphomutase (TIGR03848 family)